MATKIAILGIQILGLAALSGQASDGTTNAPVYPWMFKTQVITQSGPGLLPSPCASITLGTNKVAFLLPPGYRIDASEPQTVTVVSDDYSRAFTLRVTGPMPPDTTHLDSDNCRDALLASHPRATIQAELGLGAANQFGPAFDIRWVPRGNLDRAARVAFVPSRMGILEFSIVSSPEKFSQAKSDLNFMMLTFRASGADGKLVMPVLYDKL